MKKIVAGLVAVLISSATAFGHNWVIASALTNTCDPAIEHGPNLATPLAAYNNNKAKKRNPQIFVINRLMGQPFAVQVWFTMPGHQPQILNYWRYDQGVGLIACKEFLQRMNPAGLN